MPEYKRPNFCRNAMSAGQTPYVDSRQIEARKIVALSSHDHFHWRMSAARVPRLAEAHGDLFETMAAPYVAVASKTLSRTSQSFKDPLLFLRLVWQFAPVAFEAIMAGIDPTGSEV